MVLDISVQMQKGIKRYSKGKYVGENKYYFKAIFLKRLQKIYNG